MQHTRPLILISNDDGVQAKGINELIRMLRPIADLIVMAPDGPRSGQSGAVTITNPIFYKEVSIQEGLAIYSCTGTPVDCIKLAKFDVLDRKPDLIVGGINHGDNSSVNVHNSGTMGIAIEGCLSEVPSVGFSLCNHSEDADFRPLEPLIVRMVEQLLKKGLPKGVCLNVNFPADVVIRGLKMCKQSNSQWVQDFIKCDSPRGGDYFWIMGDMVDKEPSNTQTDHWALVNGYGSITPIRVDMTAHELIDTLAYLAL